MDKFYEYRLNEGMIEIDSDNATLVVETVVKDVCGYDGIEQFLNGNPLAAEALVGWIQTWTESGVMPEWQKNLDRKVEQISDVVSDPWNV